MKICKAILYLTYIFILGCAPSKTYFINQSDTQRNFHQDSSVCLRYAMSGTPPPVGYVQGSHPVNNFGTISGFDQYGNTYWGSYQSYGYHNNPADDMHNIMASLQNYSRVSVMNGLYKSCLSHFGWKEFTEDELMAMRNEGINTNANNKIFNNDPNNINKNNDIETLKNYVENNNVNNIDTLFRLGYLYETRGQDQNDYIQAKKWYEKAAIQGHGEAQNNLGMLYETGKGIKRDIQETKKWYKMACDRNIEESCQSYDRLK